MEIKTIFSYTKISLEIILLLISIVLYLHKVKNRWSHNISYEDYNNENCVKLSFINHSDVKGAISTISLNSPNYVVSTHDINKFVKCYNNSYFNSKIFNKVFDLFIILGKIPYYFYINFSHCYINKIRDSPYNKNKILGIFDDARNEHKLLNILKEPHFKIHRNDGNLFISIKVLLGIYRHQRKLYIHYVKHHVLMIKRRMIKYGYFKYINNDSFNLKDLIMYVPFIIWRRRYKRLNKLYHHSKMINVNDSNLNVYIIILCFDRETYKKHLVVINYNRLLNDL